MDQRENTRDSEAPSLDSPSPMPPASSDTAIAPGLKSHAIWSSTYLKVTIWVVTAVASALIGVTLKWWWEAPRPAVELSTVQLRAVASDEARVDLSLEIRERISRHAYIDNPKTPTTVKDVNELLVSAAANDVTMERLAARIDRLLELLRTRPESAENVDGRRLEFLTAWVEGGNGAALETTVKYVLAAQEESLPAHYRKRRPPGSLQWVQLPDSVVSLDEIDEVERARAESSARGAVNVYERVLRDARNTNLIRRMWVFMEPRVMVPILQTSKARLKQQVDQSRDITQQLDAFLAKARPHHLVATLTVANRGGRPLALRNIGVLHLQLPPRSGGGVDQVTIDLAGDKAGGVTVVAPGGVEVMDLRSVKTAADLVLEHGSLRGSGSAEKIDGAAALGGSRLKALFDGEGVSARVALAWAGAPPDRSLLAITDARPVGTKGNEMVLAVLRNKTQ